jgi:hypothetical protein
MKLSYSKRECDRYAQWLHQILVAGWSFPTLLWEGIQFRKLIAQEKFRESENARLYIFTCFIQQIVSFLISAVVLSATGW